MLSPIIFIACLLAPTVPSDPSPQNLQFIVSLCSNLKLASTGIEVFVTSSSIPTVNWFLGLTLAKLSNIAFILAGVTSFEPNPYLPPIS